LSKNTVIVLVKVLQLLTFVVNILQSTTPITQEMDIPGLALLLYYFTIA